MPNTCDYTVNSRQDLRDGQDLNVGLWHPVHYICTSYRFWNTTPARAKPLTKPPTSTSAHSAFSAVLKLFHPTGHNSTIKTSPCPPKTQNPDHTPISARNYPVNFRPDLQDAQDLSGKTCAYQNIRIC